MKLNDSIKKFLKEQAFDYQKEQLERAQLNHDWKYGMGVRFFGTQNDTKIIRLSKEQWQEIKEILTR